MAYVMVESDLYDLRYGSKRAVWLTVRPKESCMVCGMAERELYDLRYDRKKAVTLTFQI